MATAKFDPDALRKALADAENQGDAVLPPDVVGAHAGALPNATLPIDSGWWEPTDADVIESELGAEGFSNPN